MENTKVWYKSKTLYGVLGAIVLALLNLFNVVPDNNLVNLLTAGFAAFAGYGRIVATDKLK